MRTFFEAIRLSRFEQWASNFKKEENVEYFD